MQWSHFCLPSLVSLFSPLFRASSYYWPDIFPPQDLAVDDIPKCRRPRHPPVVLLLCLRINLMPLIKRPSSPSSPTSHLHLPRHRRPSESRRRRPPVRRSPEFIPAGETFPLFFFGSFDPDPTAKIRSPISNQYQPIG
jgi:hypothetical protein